MPISGFDWVLRLFPLGDLIYVACDEWWFLSALCHKKINSAVSHDARWFLILVFGSILHRGNTCPITMHCNFYLWLVLGIA